jgi:hypothetical protein
MEEENFSEKESLQLINEMIGKAKKSHIEKGIASIIWGALIFFCSVYTWAEIEFDFNGGDPWILTLIAVIVQIFFGIKDGKKKNFKSYESDAISSVWIAFGISMFVLIVYSNKHPSQGEITSLFMMLYAIPTFVTGKITKFLPMIYGGIFCWAASIASIYTTFKTDNLLMAACGLFAWLIPGIILWLRYKKNKVANV